MCEPVNLDKFPGAESFSVKVYANNEANPKAVAIHQGSVEIVTFDGIFSTPTNLPPVLRTWKFEGADLSAHQFKLSRLTDSPGTHNKNERPGKTLIYRMRPSANYFFLDVGCVEGITKYGRCCTTYALSS